MVRQIDTIQDRSVRASVKVALQCDGRLVDADELAAQYRLDDEACEVIRGLAALGNEGLGVHRFGALHIGEINCGSAMGMVDQTTYVLARRTRGSQIKYWWETETGCEGDLPVSSQPLNFWEAATLMNRVLVAVAPYPVTGGWTTGYFPHDASLEVKSVSALASTRSRALVPRGGRRVVRRPSRSPEMIVMIEEPDARSNGETTDESRPRCRRTPLVRVQMVQLVREGSAPFALKQINSPVDAYLAFKGLCQGADREHVWVALMNNKNRVVAVEEVSRGTLTSSLMHPRECFKSALLTNAAKVLFIHNHPSGDPAPSVDDIEIPRRLRAVGDLIGVPVVDHLVVGRDSFISMASDGFW